MADTRYNQVNQIFSLGAFDFGNETMWKFYESVKLYIGLIDRDIPPFDNQIVYLYFINQNLVTVKLLTKKLCIHQKFGQNV